MEKIPHYIVKYLLKIKNDYASHLFIKYILKGGENHEYKNSGRDAFTAL